MIVWKVLWTKSEGGKTFRKFPGSSPKDAVEFAKELKRQGMKPNVVCANKAWRPTTEQELKRRPGMIWCPYCVKWRNFKLFRVRKKSYTTEAFMRCPVCTISTNDFYVKKFNGFLEHITEADLIKKLTRYEGG
jgi:hypothetical protein